MRVNMCSICEKSIFMSSNLPAMNERGWMFFMHVYVCSTCDISMLGSSILQSMNEAWLDVYACLCV